MSYWAGVGNIILIFSILGISLNLVLGFSGMVSMAHAVYFGVSAYLTALIAMSMGLDLLTAGIVATVLTGFFAAITAFPALRVRDEYLILLTLAIQMIVTGVMNTWVAVTGGPSGIPGIPSLEIAGLVLVDTTQVFPVLLLVTTGVFLLVRKIVNAPLGRILKAMRDNESATQAAGKNIVCIKVMIFGVSGAIAGMAGVLFTAEQGFIDPLSFDLDTSILIIALVALGGVANLYGTIVGAVLVLGLPELLTFFNVGSSDTVNASRGIVFGVLLIVFTRFRPQGIIPEKFLSKLPKKIKIIKNKNKTKNINNSDADKEVIRDSFKKVYSEYKKEESILVVKDLHKRFGGVVTADGVNINLVPGKITALIGPNGAGKTTIFNMIAGVIAPDSGSIVVHGKDITEMPTWKRVYEGIGRSFQDVRIFENLSVIENVIVAIPNQSGESIKNILFKSRKIKEEENKVFNQAFDLLDDLGLKEKAFYKAGDLGYGEQKLLAIARLIATEAEILLFDEPAAGVDAGWANKMIDIIKRLAESGKTVCLVEHNLNVVKELADHVYFLNLGSIVAEGNPQEIMQDSALAEIYFGYEV